MLETTPLNITDAEWEVMRVVWANKYVTSRKIRDVLEVEKDWKSATIKTLLGRLVDKGALRTEKDGRRFIYSAVVTEQESMATFIDDVLSRVCNKQSGNVIGDIVERTELSKSDIAMLKELLNEKEITALDEVPCGCIKGQCDCHLH